MCPEVIQVPSKFIDSGGEREDAKFFCVHVGKQRTSPDECPCPYSAITDTITGASENKRAYSNLNAYHQPLCLHTSLDPLRSMLTFLLIIIWQLLLEGGYGGVWCPLCPQQGSLAPRS